MALKLAIVKLAVSLTQEFKSGCFSVNLTTDCVLSFIKIGRTLYLEN